LYIRKTNRIYKGKTYTNHLLVESVQTPDGPRQRTICSLGSLEPAPAQDWLALAHKLESSLQGQASLSESATPIDELSKKAGREKKRPTSPAVFQIDGIRTEQSRERTLYGTLPTRHPHKSQMARRTDL
jgi:hypothetical protein